MAIKKCERCDLNYVKEGEKYCKVCKKIMEGESSSSPKAELCPSCGERLVAKGYELCKVCLTDRLDSVETLEDENNDAVDQNITPADMEISEINLVEDEEEDVPEDIKNDLDEENYDIDYEDDDI
jgi:ribosome assembly protein YihI (activator of Der GTPase)